MNFAKKLVIVLVFLTTYNAISQDNRTLEGNEAFFFDALVFKGESSDSSRIDCYFMLPYQTLNFTKSQDVYVAKYEAIIAVHDSLNNRIYSKTISKSLVERDYVATQGGRGEFEVSQVILNLPPGKYRIRAIIIDEFARKEYSQARNITVIDYSQFPLSLSALMLVSTIEEVNGRYKITPHISDNIGNISDAFFTFFEVYNNADTIQKIDFIYQIFENDELIEMGKRNNKTIETGTNRTFLRIEKPARFSQTNFVLRVLALMPSDSDEYEMEDVRAIAQRSIRSSTRMSGLVLNDINIAIRQLRYVASQHDIEEIRSAETDDEKVIRFQAFWKSLDPTPATERNEAFDEYYRRIAFANKNFKSYTEGWLTDKGMVFITFGQPMHIERSSQYGDGRVYEIWRYQSNREFLFVDNTGFGDFRLIRPVTVVEKFKYE